MSMKPQISPFALLAGADDRALAVDGSRVAQNWCARAQRWQAPLDGVLVSAPTPKISGFVGARVPGAIAATVRIELHAGSTCMQLHWPVANARDLADWLREIGR